MLSILLQHRRELTVDVAHHNHSKIPKYFIEVFSFKLRILFKLTCLHLPASLPPAASTQVDPFADSATLLLELPAALASVSFSL